MPLGATLTYITRISERPTFPPFPAWGLNIENEKEIRAKEKNITYHSSHIT